MLGLSRPSSIFRQPRLKDVLFYVFRLFSLKEDEKVTENPNVDTRPPKNSTVFLLSVNDSKMYSS